MTVTNEGIFGSVEALANNRAELAAFRDALTPPAPVRTDRRVRFAVLSFGGLGGSGKVAAETTIALAERGHEAHLITGAGNRWIDVDDPRVSWHIAAVPRVPRVPEPAWIEVLAAQLRDQLAAIRPEVLLVHYAAGLLGAALAARANASSPRIACILHGTDITTWACSSEHGPGLRAELARADRVVAVSRWLAERAVGCGLSTRPEVISNSVDTELFHPRRWQLATRERASSPFVLGHVSNLRPLKRATDAVETLGLVRQRGVCAELVVIGDGPDYDALESRALALGVRDHVQMLGELPAHRVAPLLAALDALLVCSTSESFSLVALEAFASGVPVIGTDCGGFPELLCAQPGLRSHREQLVVPVASPGLMADKVCELWADAVRYREIQCEGIRLAVQHYPRIRQIDQYDQLIAELAD